MPTGTRRSSCQTYPKTGTKICPCSSNGLTVHVPGFRQIAVEFGEDGLRDTLQVAMVWSDHNRFRADLLKGIAEALDAKDTEIVLANARRWGTSDNLYRKANDDARGRGYRTISNITNFLSSSRRRKPLVPTVHES